MGDVVVVPGAQQDGRRGGAPGHHEAGEIRDVDVGLDVDGGVDDEADKGQQEAEGDEGEAQARVVGREGQDEQDDGADDVGRDGVEVGLDAAVAEAGDNLRQEEGHALQRHAEADFDAQPGVGGGHLEDLEGFLEVEFLVDDGGGIHLHALEGDALFFFGQEPGIRPGSREVEEGEDGEDDSHGSLDEEQNPPARQVGVDL